MDIAISNHVVSGLELARWKSSSKHSKLTRRLGFRNRGARKISRNSHSRHRFAGSHKISHLQPFLLAEEEHSHSQPREKDSRIEKGPSLLSHAKILDAIIKRGIRVVNVYTA
jgi:hypothetical protein